MLFGGKAKQIAERIKKSALTKEIDETVIQTAKKLASISIREQKMETSIEAAKQSLKDLRTLIMGDVERLFTVIEKEAFTVRDLANELDARRVDVERYVETLQEKGIVEADRNALGEKIYRVNKDQVRKVAQKISTGLDWMRRVS